MIGHWWVAHCMWQCDTMNGVRWINKVGRWLDAYFLTGYRYRRHVKNWKKRLEK